MNPREGTALPGSEEGSAVTMWREKTIATTTQSTEEGYKESHQKMCMQMCWEQLPEQTWQVLNMLREQQVENMDHSNKAEVTEDDQSAEGRKRHPDFMLFSYTIANDGLCNGRNAARSVSRGSDSLPMSQHWDRHCWTFMAQPCQ